MTRNYRLNAALIHRVYDARDVQALYGISENTVANWIHMGLRPIEGTRPMLFRGDELARFHKQRKAKLKSRYKLTQCGPGEFFCLHCKEIVRPALAQITFTSPYGTKLRTQGICPLCGYAVFKRSNEAERDILLSGNRPNTQQDSPCEYKAALPLDIGGTTDPDPEWNPHNEIVIYEWQVMAERHHDKTQAAHLTVIRQFETLVGRKSFADLDHHDVGRYRNWLKDRYQGGGEDAPLAKSTVRHMASYMRAFLTWLAKFNPKYAHLAGLPEYLILPKALTGRDLDQKSRQFVTLEHAKDLLGQLPATTMVQRRDRAMFATAFTTGFRKNALTSLSLSHIDVKARSAHHDGRKLRAKNGKTFRAFWFPGTEPFGHVLTEWYAEMLEMGAGPEDALFPASSTLDAPAVIADPQRERIKPMASTHAIDGVFTVASRLADVSLTPHSARDTLVAYGDSLALSERQRKAWSENLGHDSETITRRYYGKLSSDECAVELARITTEPLLIEDDIMKALALDMHFYRNGTPEFEDAKRARARIEPLIAQKLKLMGG